MNHQEPRPMKYLLVLPARPHAVCQRMREGVATEVIVFKKIEFKTATRCRWFDRVQRGPVHKPGSPAASRLAPCMPRLPLFAALKPGRHPGEIDSKPGVRLRSARQPAARQPPPCSSCAAICYKSAPPEPRLHP